MSDYTTRESRAALLAKVPEGYTPGPWFVDEANPELVARSGLDGAFIYIAEVGGICDDENEIADAALIALAPELAAALQASEAELAALQSKHDSLTGEKFSDRCHAALKARAEKAEAELDASRAESERCQAALLKVRRALGLGRDSNDDLIDVIAANRERERVLREAAEEMADSIRRSGACGWMESACPCEDDCPVATYRTITRSQP